MEVQRSFQLSANTKVTILGAAPNVDLDGDLYAINWFDLKRPWLYDLYNRLAYPHLKAVGGQLHFKGAVAEKLRGPDENDRNMLLIVRYPGAGKFLSMMSSKAFLMKSVLRIRSVDYFTFGFTRRMDTGPRPPDEPTTYKGDDNFLLFHFQNNKVAAEIIYELNDIIPSFGIKPYFMGYKAAIIGRSSNEEKLKTLPFLMDGLAVLVSSRIATLRDFAESKELQSLMKKNLTNSLYIMKRML